MRMVPACLRALAAGSALAWAASAAFAAAPAAPDKDDKPAHSAERRRADLDKVISIDIEGQPLDLAVQLLGEKSHIPFVLDANAIAQAGIQPNAPPTPVTIRQDNVKVRDVLRKIVGMYGLGYAVLGETVVITTEDMAVARQMSQHVNIDIDKTPLTDALKQLSKESAVNLVPDPHNEKELSAPVTLQLEDVRLDTAVRLLAEEANLKAVRIGNTMFVTSKEKAAELRQEPDLSQPLNPGQPVPQPPGLAIPQPVVPVAPPVVNPPAPPTPPAVDPDKTPGDNKSDADKKDPEKSPKDGDK